MAFYTTRIAKAKRSKRLRNRRAQRSCTHTIEQLDQLATVRLSDDDWLTFSELLDDAGRDQRHSVDLRRVATQAAGMINAGLNLAEAQSGAERGRDGLLGMTRKIGGWQLALSMVVEDAGELGSKVTAQVSRQLFPTQL